MWVALGGMFVNRWFITVCVHPAKGVGSKLWSWLPKFKQQPLDTMMSASCAGWRTWSTSSRPRSLNTSALIGSVEVPTDIEGLTLPVTDGHGAASEPRTAVDQPIPHTYGPLSVAIYCDRVVFARRHST